MAERGKRLDQYSQERIRTLAKHLSIKGIARRLCIDRNTVRKYLRLRVEVSPQG